MIDGDKEYIDIIKEDEFLAECSEFLGTALHNEYSVTDTLPLLYKYKRLSSYSVDDICSSRFTATAIGEFNDIFDGAIQRKGSQRLNRRAYGDFNLAAFVGTYVFCLSENNNSTLMWSHYAAENKGICIEYDFNTEDKGSVFRRCLFPVAYTETPISVLPIIENETERQYLYPHDTAILCAALNKSENWLYEHEWRYVEIDVQAKTQRLYRDCIVPSRIIFGNRFLKPLFYYSNDDAEKRKKCMEHYDLIIRLVDFMIDKNIMGAIAVPKLGSFELETVEMPPTALKEFLQKDSLLRSKCYEMHMYNETYYRLLGFLEKAQP